MKEALQKIKHAAAEISSSAGFIREDLNLERLNDSQQTTLFNALREMQTQIDTLAADAETGLL